MYLKILLAYSMSILKSRWNNRLRQLFYKKLIDIQSILFSNLKRNYFEADVSDKTEIDKVLRILESHYLKIRKHHAEHF